MKSFSSGFRMIPMFVLMGIIFILSNQPGVTFQPFVFFSFEDKIVHCCLYGILAFTVMYAAASSQRRAWRRRFFYFFAVSMTVLYGISDEIHQYFIPGRSSSCADLLADFTGAVLCCLLVEILRKKGLKIFQSVG